MTDTHAHYYVEAYDADREDALTRAVEVGVTKILCPAIGSETHGAMLALCDRHSDFLLPMMGVHPTELNDNPDWERELLLVGEYLASCPGRFVAVGEIGLDLHWSRDFLEQQKIVFRRQLELARKYGLPIALHVRDAWSETFEVLSEFSGANLKGVMHAFSGTLEDYRRVLSLGDFVFGVGGPVTYKKSIWRELLPEMDPLHIVLETDAPWLPPEPFRGQRNESAYLPYIRDAAAGIMGLSPESLALITTENAARIFGL